MEERRAGGRREGGPARERRLGGGGDRGVRRRRRPRPGRRRSPRTGARDRASRTSRPRRPRASRRRRSSGRVLRSGSRSSARPPFRGGSSRARPGFTSVPISGTWISTQLPGTRLNESGGTSPVPVRSTDPGGTGFSRTSHDASSWKVRTMMRRRGLVLVEDLALLVGDAHDDLEAQRLARRDVERRADRARARVDLRLGQVERVRAPRSRGRRRRSRSCTRGSCPRSPTTSADLGLGHVPGRVAADPDRLAGADGAPRPGVLEEELGPVGVVDEVVDVLDRRSPPCARRGCART